MALTGIQAYALSKKYTDNSMAGGGSVAGKNCVIDSITPITGGNRVTFKWTLDNGTVQTNYMDVMDGDKGETGDDGLGIKSVDINAQNHLIITYDDDTMHDAGELPGGSGEVISVNGKKGVVTLDANDVGALPDDTELFSGDYEDLSNKPDLTQFITKSVNDLVNYYTKSQTYTKTEVDNIITAVKNSRFEMVDTLPTTDIKTNVIYLVPKSTAQTSNVKDEYINLDGTSAGWEKIGDTEIDLSGYVTTAALNTALADYTTTTALTALLDGKVDKVTGKGLSTNDYTTADKEIVDGVTDALADKADKTSVIQFKTTTETDANNLWEETGYYIVNTSDMTNLPTTDVSMGYCLEVIRYGSQSSSIVIQIAYRGNPTTESPIYMRRRFNSAWTDWVAIAKKSEVTEKADKVASATNGNFAGLDASGNLTDSGKKAADFQPVIPAAFTGDLNTLSARGFHQYTAAYADLSNAPTVSYTVNKCYIDVWSDGAGNVCQIIKLVGLTYDPAAKYCDIFKRSCYSTGSALSWGTWEKLNGKADLITSPTNNNLVAMDANGNLKDSGKKAADFATPEDVETSASAQEALLRDTVGWTGKNLLKNTATSRTLNGVTFTVNADGSVTANGTASARAIYDIGSISEADSYILNGCPSGGGSTTYGIFVSMEKTGETTQYENDYGSGAGFQLQSGWIARIRVDIKSGQTVSNLTFYPMIRRADILDDTYEPYHESVEEEITQVYADNGVLGAKNLLPNNESTATRTGITFTVNRDANGGVESVIADGTQDGAGDGADFNIPSSGYYPVSMLTNGMILTKGNTTGIDSLLNQIWYYDSSNTYIEFQNEASSGNSLNHIVINIPANAAYFRVNYRIPKNKTVSNLTFYPMLRLASDPDDTYQPYAMTNRELTEKVSSNTLLSWSNYYAVDTELDLSDSIDNYRKLSFVLGRNNANNGLQTIDAAVVPAGIGTDDNYTRLSFYDDTATHDMVIQRVSSTKLKITTSDLTSSSYGIRTVIGWK